MPQIPTLLELLQAGVHFGHKESRWHPKMEPFIFGARNGIHIIDLNQTIVQLKRTLDNVQELASRGGIILFLGTKRQARDIIRKNADMCGMPYIVDRWLGGTLTNFESVIGLVKRYHELKEKMESGEIAKKYTKRERNKFQKQIDELEERIGGIQSLQKMPDAIYVIDVPRERTAVQEAAKKGIPIIALCDTNVNPDNVQYPIPSNDDAVKTIELMTRLIAEAVNEGKANPKTPEPAAAGKEADRPKAKAKA